MNADYLLGEQGQAVLGLAVHGGSGTAEENSLMGL